MDLDSANAKAKGDYDVVMMDGTKVRSTARRGHHNVNVILGKKGDNVHVLRASVNEDPAHAAKKVEDRLSNDATAVTDGELSLRDAFKVLDIPVQQCLIHVLRNVGYAMGDEGASRDERASVKRELANHLVALRRSVTKHRTDGDWSRLAWGTNDTRQKLLKLAENLAENGWHTAAAFLKTEADAIVLFARMAPEGANVPWSTNLVERVMGEIAKRVKHEWMHWSDAGLDALLNMLLIRLKNPDVYDAWWNGQMRASEKPAVRAEVIHALATAEG